MNAVSGWLGTGAGLRQPPAAIEVEQGLIGRLLSYPPALAQVPDLRPEHFADPAYARIFATIVRLCAAGDVPDLVTVGAALDGDAALAEVGGRAHLAQLVAAAPGGGVAKPYARRLRDLALRRAVINVADEASARAYDAAADTDGECVVAEAVAALLDAVDANRVAPVVDLGAAAEVVVRQAEAACRGEDNGRILTGIGALDGLVGGFLPGRLTYLAARSRTGKSSVALQIARGVASRLVDAAGGGKAAGCVGFFSLEMTAADVGAVNLAARTGIPVERIVAGGVADRELFVLAEAQRELTRLPIVVDDHGGLDVDALCLRARALAQRKHAKLLIVDYRELIGRPRDMARASAAEWVPTLGQRLKELAKALRIPIIVLTQINKSVDTQENTTPSLHSLPYDGGQAADLVIALHRPELYLPTEPPILLGKKQSVADEARATWERDRQAVAGVLELHVLKNRFGRNGSARMRWDGPRMSVADLGGAP